VRLKTKLILINSISLCIILIIVFISWYSLEKLYRSIDNLVNIEIPTISNLNMINTSIESSKAAIRTMQLPKVPLDRKDRQLKILIQNTEQVNKNLESLKKLTSSEEVKEFEGLFNSINRLNNGVNKFIIAYKAGNEELDSIDNVYLVPELQAIKDKYINTILARRMKEINSSSIETIRNLNLEKNILLIVSVLGTILIIIFNLLIIRSITNKLEADPDNLNIIAARIANGELNHNIVYTIDSSVLGSIAKMNNSLADLVKSIKLTAERVVSSASDSKAQLEQLATAMEEVSAQSATIATASEEMSATSNDIAKNCQYVADASNNTNNIVIHGVVIVNETVKGIVERGLKIKDDAKILEELGTNIEEIGQITTKIDDIADSINLLALNAAIEAARAGEAGRGFAVVADEVRKLSDVTTRSTQEIAGMIKAIQSQTITAIRSLNDSVIRMEKGANSAQDLKSNLDTISEEVASINSQITQIATAAEEQTATTSEITNNVHQTTLVVHDNAMAVANVANLLAKVETDINELVASLDKFKL